MIGPREDPRAAAMAVLGRRRAQARAVVLFERVWTAAWPALGLLGLFACVALLGLPQSLSAWPHAAVLAGFGGAFAWLAARAVRRVRAAGPAQADRRLEAASGLRHRPLSVLEDAPATGEANALWQAHAARAAASLARLRVGLPRPGLAARDMRALRGLLVVGLVACVVVAGAEAPGRLLAAVRPGFAPPIPLPPTEVQAWITPPGYTGQAPVFLKPDGAPVTVPAGSHLTASVTGGSGEPNLLLGEAATAFRPLDAGSWQADLDLAVGGRLAVRRGGGDVAAWPLTVVADQAPMVRFPEPPGAARGQARLPATRLPWEVSHAYGVASLRAELRLRDRPEAPPLVVSIPLPSGAVHAAHGARVQDLTAHPWAGLPVVARLVATDAPGQVGTSEPAEFMLPERRFANPIARAIIEVRRMLSLKPEARDAAVAALEQIGSGEEAWRGDTGGYLNLRSAMGQLRYDRGADAVAQVQQRLWLLALHLEEGAPERTERALAEARETLRQSLEAEKRGEKVDPAEIDREMRAVQEALEKHLQALAEQARRDPDANKFDPNKQAMDARDLARLAEQAREAAKRGNMDQARREMAELDKLLQDLESGRPEHGQMTERDRKRAEKRQRGQQDMSVLRDIVQREGGLLDRAQQRADAGLREQRTRPGQPPPPAAPAAGAREADQRTQQALRRALGELMQQYGDLMGEVPPNLGDADTAMREARDAIAQAQDAPAAGAARRAIEALQKGGQSMSSQMAQQFGESGDDGAGDEEADGQGSGDGQGDQPGTGLGSQPGRGQGRYGGREFGDRGGRLGRPWDGGRWADRRADDHRDPLGRPTRDGTSGADESGTVAVPDQMEAARGRAIQDELRRRDGERGRPQPELDYIERLLKQF